MNVFWLAEDPREAARYHCDLHINKMLLEAAQLLCTAAREHGHDAEFLYRSTHTDHPLAEWAAESRANWDRLYEFARALNEEFMERYDHDEPHASWETLDRIDRDALSIPEDGETERPQCMPDEYRRPGDPVGAYRTYYANDKGNWAEWNHTPEPDWLDDYRIDAEV